MVVVVVVTGAIVVGTVVATGADVVGTVEVVGSDVGTDPGGLVVDEVVAGGSVVVD